MANILTNNGTGITVIAIYIYDMNITFLDYFRWNGKWPWKTKIEKWKNSLFMNAINPQLCYKHTKGIQAVRIDFFYIKSCQYSMFYTNWSWTFS